jgi:hypothetical protein
VSPETYATLLKLAEVEKVSLTDLVRVLIELGLGKKTKPAEEDITVLERINAMNADVWKRTKYCLSFSAAVSRQLPVRVILQRSRLI